MLCSFGVELRLWRYIEEYRRGDSNLDGKVDSFSNKRTLKNGNDPTLEGSLRLSDAANNNGASTEKSRHGSGGQSISRAPRAPQPPCPFIYPSPGGGLSKSHSASVVASNSSTNCNLISISKSNSGSLINSRLNGKLTNTSKPPRLLRNNNPGKHDNKKTS